MNVFRFKFLMLIAAISMTTSACTIPQLAMWKQVTGYSISPQHETSLLELPDVPIRMPDGNQVNPDGSITAIPVIDRVNSFTYTYKVGDAAMQAYRLVAADRGWSPAQISSWEIAIDDIMRKESGYCWNLRRGAVFAYYDGRGCVLKRQGAHSDSGFGQLISIWRPVTCRRANVCTTDATVASPWNSMSALLAVIEESGVGPWCYSSYARSYHRAACNNPGLNVG